MVVPPGHDAICQRCLHAQAVAAAESLVEEARRLLNGQPPYDELTDDEWAEQVAALLAAGDGDPAAVERVARMSDADLIAAVADRTPGVLAAASAEIVRRLDVRGVPVGSLLA